MLICLSTESSTLVRVLNDLCFRFLNKMVILFLLQDFMSWMNVSTDVYVLLMLKVYPNIIETARVIIVAVL